MSSQTTKNVAVLQGNATVARLMREFLEDSQYEVELLEGPPPGAARAHLVIVDVDSGIDSAEQWIRHCDGRQLPVLVSGVQSSQQSYAERPWLSRPFSGDQLVSLCREVVEGGDGQSEHEEIPPAIDVDPNLKEQPTLEVPSAASLDLSGEEQDQDNQDTARQSAEELLDVLELDASGSMILEIEDLDGGDAGGILVEVGQRRPLPPAELVDHNPWSGEPDTAVELNDGPPPSEELESRADAEPTVSSAVHPMLEQLAGISSRDNAEVTAVSSFRDVASGDFSSAHRVASLVAEYWDRLGLTARPADRADRLQRIFTAMFRDGMDGVLDVLKRIPPVSGFSGRLETVSVIDLLHMIRDRGLRGRLEVGLNGHSFVIYIDRTTLHEIDSLGENTDGLLIQILHQIEALDEREYQHYQRMLNKISGEPLEMKLRRDAVVDEAQLLEAKKVRARQLLDKMCRGTRGTFAFIEINRDGSQSWPARGLKLNVDALLLEIFRESSMVDAKSHLMTPKDLVLNSERASNLEPEALTDSERQLLEFFQDGGSVDQARETLGGGEESVDRVVRRLERLELLRQLGKGIRRDGGEAQQIDHLSATRSDSGGEENAPGPTAVSSSWELDILDEVESTMPDSWPEPPEAGPDEQTAEDVSFSAGVPEDFSVDDTPVGNDDVGEGDDS